MAAQTIKKIFRFYLDGFRSMTVGKTLWAILAGQSPEERSRSVMKELTPDK